MALDKLTLIDDTVISTTVTTAVNNLAQTNYITYPIATGNPLSNGWRVYKNTDTVAPTTGIAGSPSIALTQNTDNPLNSTGDFRITKTSGASRRGEGISTDFTIANRHLAKILQISFDYEVIVGSTLATDDIRVYIIQDPSSGTPVIIEPVNVSVQGVVFGNRMRHLATFQTHISVASYRLCIHIATTTNSNQTIDFNGFRVWEPTQTIGSIITDWVSYTPTFGAGFSSTPTNVSAFSRRVGSELEFRGVLTTGSILNNPTTISLGFNGSSGGITINGSKVGANQIVGQATQNQSGAGYIYNVLANGGNNFMQFAYSQNGATNPILPMVGQLAGNNIFEWYGSVPIAGWGSNVAMSGDSGDGRIVAATYNSISGSYSIGSSETIVKFENRLSDSHSAYSGSTGFFTSPVSGWYQINASIVLSTNTLSNIKIKLDNTTDIVFVFGSNNRGTVSTAYYLNAGQTLSVYATANTATALNPSHNLLSIYRISAGSQQIAVTETVACSYHANSGGAPQTSPSITLKLPTRIYDTHGAWGITTGQFTAPMSGKYRVTLIGSTGGGQPVQLFRQNAPYCWMGNSEWTTGTFSSSCEVDLLAGNVIDIRTSNGPSGATAWGGGTLGNNSVTVISISRIGM